MTVREAKHQKMLEEWKERVKVCRNSGQTVLNWCKEQGICSKTYYHWEREVKQTARAHPRVEREPQFVQLPRAKAEAEMQNDKGRLAARVYKGNTTLELYEGAGAELVTALFEVFGHAE